MADTGKGGLPERSDRGDGEVLQRTLHASYLMRWRRHQAGVPPLSPIQAPPVTPPAAGELPRAS